MMVSGGYPGEYKKGLAISGLEKVKGSYCFHAGTRKTNTVVTNGGRVMAVTSLGNNLEETLKKCYCNASEITFEGSYYRKDIGYEFTTTI